MATGTETAIAPPPGFVPEQPEASSAPPPPPTGFIPESEHLAGPTHTAARRNAMAQPGITPEARTAALPGDKPAWDSPENPQLGNPTGTLPIGKEEQTAATLAGSIAGLGEGNMGMPSPAKVTPWSTLKGYGRKILGLPEGEGTGGWTPQQAAPLNRQLPAAKEPIITPPPADRSGPIPPEERIDLGRGGYPEPKPAAPPQAKPLTGSTSQQVDQLVNTAYGVKPLEKGVPLRSQIETKGYGAQYNAPKASVPATETAQGATQATAKPLTPTPQPNAPETPPKAQPMSLAEKYPDKAVRQMVHANGEKIVNAVGEDPETMQALHSLTAVDLRQALINSGEDLGQRAITSSKFAGPGAITRQQAFERLLEKGQSPQDIVRLAQARP